MSIFNSPFGSALKDIKNFLRKNISKETVTNDDKFLISDSADSDKLKQVLYSTFKDQIVGDIGPLTYQGDIDASGPPYPNYPAASKGDVYAISQAGKIGGESGRVVYANDKIHCKEDSVAGDQATVGDKWGIIQGNLEYETDTGEIKMDGAVAVGVSGKVPRADHVHPSDTAKVSHDLATAESDFLVGAPTPFGSWIKKTLAETKTILAWVLTSTAEATGFKISGGTTSRTLTVDEDVTISHKADKAVPATPKNLAGLAETTGNLEDSLITPAVGTDSFSLAGGTSASKTLTVDETKAVSDKVNKETGKSLVADTEIAKIHTQDTDTNLGALSTKDPVIDADLVISRDSEDDDKLKTSTWAQIKAFLKTHYDTVYAAVTGTTSTTFQVDSDNTGPKLKNIAGTMAVRNEADDADAPIRVSEVLVDDPVEAIGEYTIWEVPGALGEVFAKCTVECTNVDGGTQESVIHFYRMIAGTLTKVLTIDNTPE